jgi:hypothetical protein
MKHPTSIRSVNLLYVTVFLALFGGSLALPYISLGWGVTIDELDFVALLPAASLLVDCGARSSLRIGWRETDGLKGKSACYASFSGLERRTLRLDAGETVALTYDVEVEEGALTLSLVDPDGEPLWKETFQQGAADEIRVRAPRNGRYELRIEGHQTGGSFDFSWRVHG